jgi:phosphatidylglycerophosphatase A
MRRRLGLFIATFGYLGYAPIAPGTFGSAAGVVMFYAVRATGSDAVELATIAVLFAVGIWAGTEAEHHFGGLDPGPAVIDEVVGMLITLALLPVSGWGVFAGFLIFRVLDVIKPWPAGRFERLPGGLGVMADDGMAALYGNLIMQALLWAAPAWFRA